MRDAGLDPVIEDKAFADKRILFKLAKVHLRHVARQRKLQSTADGRAKRKANALRSKEHQRRRQVSTGVKTRREVTLITTHHTFPCRNVTIAFVQFTGL